MDLLIIIILWPALAYLAGSIPSGLIIVRCVAGTDVRHTGSGNIGATNVRRIAGGRWALLALVCDLLKGMLPTMGAAVLAGTHMHWLPAVSALASIAGHIYPVYLKFKPSGKGVATAMGAFLILAPLAVFIALLVFILTVRKIRRISAGSLMAAMALPPGIWFTMHDILLTVCGLITMILIGWRHEDNLRRMARGEEPTLGENRE